VADTVTQRSAVTNVLLADVRRDAAARLSLLRGVRRWRLVSSTLLAADQTPEFAGQHPDVIEHIPLALLQLSD